MIPRHMTAANFFTPISLVQLIVNVIEPDHGTVLDPACGSGGMFVQSAHFIEQLKKDPTKLATFYGMEKNPTTIRLAKMNLAVHGLEGRINKAISYYEDPHELVGKADFVMANPPFNVDEIDAHKIRRDPRLPYGLPGVNKGGKVSNGNYVWISYFDAYLNKKGRAGFVMSSQASSASGEEARLRRDLIKSGHVDVMIAIRGNFFYTRSVPCELWFLNKSKPKERQDKVLMLDARAIYRVVTRKIYDFSPEQLANLTSIVWLYRGENDRFTALIQQHLARAINAAETSRATTRVFLEALSIVAKDISIYFKGSKSTHHVEFKAALKSVMADAVSLGQLINKTISSWNKITTRGHVALLGCTNRTDELAEVAHSFAKQIDSAVRMLSELIDVADNNDSINNDELWDARRLRSLHKNLEEKRIEATGELNLIRYFVKHARWLQDRFPDAKLRDVEGLVKLVPVKALETHDWSLAPGRYVGIAPQEDLEGFDFEETMRTMHQELSGLDQEAKDLAKLITKQFEALLS
jgi:type I restriction enzyme M protein